MKAKMLTTALLVAAMLGASMSASAKGRRSEAARFGKGDVRKEIKFRNAKCPRCAEFRKMEKFGAVKKFDMRFSDPKFRDARWKGKRFDAARKHAFKRHRR